MNAAVDSVSHKGLNRTAWAIALFFGVLIAFNVAFYVVALTHPVDLLPTPTAATAPAQAPAPATPAHASP
jgi:hypothetical protein